MYQRLCFEAQLLPKKYAEHQAVKEQLAGSWIANENLEPSSCRLLLVSPGREAGRRCRRQAWAIGCQHALATNPSRMQVPGRSASLGHGITCAYIPCFVDTGRSIDFSMYRFGVAVRLYCIPRNAEQCVEIQAGTGNATVRQTLSRTSPDSRCEKEAVKCAGTGLGPISARQGSHVHRFRGLVSAWTGGLQVHQHMQVAGDTWRVLLRLCLRRLKSVRAACTNPAKS